MMQGSVSFTGHTDSQSPATRISRGLRVAPAPVQRPSRHEDRQLDESKRDAPEPSSLTMELAPDLCWKCQHRILLGIPFFPGSP